MYLVILCSATIYKGSVFAHALDRTYHEGSETYASNYGFPKTEATVDGHRRKGHPYIGSTPLAVLFLRVIRREYIGFYQPEEKSS